MSHRNIYDIRSEGSEDDSLADHIKRQTSSHSSAGSSAGFRRFVRQFEVESPNELPQHIGYLTPEEPPSDTFTILGLFSSAGGFIGKAFTAVIAFFFYGTVFCLALLLLLAAIASLMEGM